ncbi:MAG: hypothetical protein ACREIP_02015 [Alphaproteobacteria bacterium]
MDPKLFRELADLSIRRGCGFGLIAVFTAMIGFSAIPYLAVRCGAFMMTAAAVIMLWRGLTAPRRSFRDTEVWLMIRDTAPPLPKDRLQSIIGAALAESYFRHARIAAYIAVTMWAVSILMWIGHKL